MIWFKRLPAFFARNRKAKVYTYEFSEIDPEQNEYGIDTAIKIVDGPLSGMAYFYTKVQYNENESNESCTCKFEWMPVNPPDGEFEVIETQELYDILGDILTDIIVNYGEEAIT